jgi:hypothetical protein
VDENSHRASAVSTLSGRERGRRPERTGLLLSAPPEESCRLAVNPGSYAQSSGRPHARHPMWKPRVLQWHVPVTARKHTAIGGVSLCAVRHVRHEEGGVSGIGLILKRANQAV